MWFVYNNDTIKKVMTWQKLNFTKQFCVDFALNSAITEPQKNPEEIRKRIFSQPDGCILWQLFLPVRPVFINDHTDATAKLINV